MDRAPGEMAGDDLELLASYVAGRATAREVEEVEQRLARDERFRASLAELRATWQAADRALNLNLSPGELDAVWSRLVAADPSLGPRQHVTGAPASAAGRQGRLHLLVPRQRRPVGWRQLAVAASVLLVLGGGAWQLGLLESRSEAPVSSAGGFVQIVSPPGLIRELRLPDGSRVTLAPGSTLTVPDPFDSNVREVHLEGRAHFQVAPDTGPAFLVHTSNAVTRVLGTEFDVRAYPGAVETEVIVRSGRVGIGSRSAQLPELRVLGAGDRGTVDQAGRVSLVPNADVSALLRWTEGALSFDGVPLRDAALEIERWYGVRIRLADPAIGDRRITGAFEREPLEFVLESITAVTGSRWEQTAQEVVLSPR